MGLTPLETPNTGLIGYTCPYIPVEILSATKYRPYCLLHGNYDLMHKGTEYARIDACPMVRANIAYVIENEAKFTTLIGTTGCDMSRRMFDIISEHTNIPVFLLHMPRTDNQRMYSDEIDWLVKQLECLSGEKIIEKLPQEIELWEAARHSISSLDMKRISKPSTLLTSDFHTAAQYYYKGEVNIPTTLSEKPSTKPRVYLVGSEISYESGDFLELLEADLSIAGDFICGLSTFLNISILKKNLSGIKKAYYNQPPCIYRRPNMIFYDHIAGQINERRCNGIIGFTLDYCDSYEFELKKMEERFRLPLLRIRADYSFQKINQLKTRITAFGEMLTS